MKAFSQIVLLALAAQAHAQTIQPLDAVAQVAESYVRSQLPPTQGKHHITATRLDPRLRLADCTDSLEAFVANNGAVTSRTTVGVRCTAATAWTLYVPVNVETEIQVFVLRRALARHARIAELDVELQTRRLPGIGTSFLNDFSNVQGRRLRRALAAGTALTADVLEREVLVERGQQVTLVAASGSIEIRAPGRALSAGSERDRVRVQNVNSLKIVEGVVENAGTVRVDL